MNHNTQSKQNLEDELQYLMEKQCEKLKEKEEKKDKRTNTYMHMYTTYKISQGSELGRSVYW